MLFLPTLRPKMKGCEICSNPAAVHPQLWLVACASIQGRGERAEKYTSRCWVAKGLGRVGTRPWANSYQRPQGPLPWHGCSHSQWITALGPSSYKPDLSHIPPLCPWTIDCSILALLARRNLPFLHQTVLLSPDFKARRKFSFRLNIFRSCLKSFRAWFLRWSNLTSFLVHVSAKCSVTLVWSSDTVCNKYWGEGESSFLWL